VSVCERLKNHDDRNIVDHVKSCSILFADIVGFTQLSSRLAPDDIVALLNNIFCAFDDLVEKYGVEKIKTIGDAYMVSSGVPEPRNNHADAIVEVGLAMLAVVKAYNVRTGSDLAIRVGVDSGSVVAGVIGRMKFAYDLWGNTVNIAARMQTTSRPGKMQITEATHKLLDSSKYVFQRRVIKVKGKGEMNTYFVKGKRGEVGEEMQTFSSPILRKTNYSPLQIRKIQATLF